MKVARSLKKLFSFLHILQPLESWLIRHVTLHMNCGDLFFHIVWPSTLEKSLMSAEASQADESRSWPELLKVRAALSWAIFDWANSAFATTVMAGFFPIFFKKYWSAGADARESTYLLGNANALSSAILAVASPILGAFADKGAGKKRFLLMFTFLGVVTTSALALVAKGDWRTAVALYVVASIGFAGSNTFSDSLLVFVARPSEYARVSALGFGIGYLGGGLLFAINVWTTLQPALFGFRDAAQAVQFSFLITGIWWAVFTIPLALFVHEDAVGAEKGALRIIREAFSQLALTTRQIRSYKNVSLFLVAYFFYIDGVNTTVRMAVDYGLALGFSSNDLIVALLVTQFVAFPAAIAYGHFAGRFGIKRSLWLAIAAYMGVTVFAYFMSTSAHFYVLAVVIGLFQGGIQSLSRSTFAEMIPKQFAGEFFGFFNMLGKFSSMVGPSLMGWTAVLLDDSRLSVLSLIPLFVIGAAVLVFVPMTHSGAARAGNPERN